MDIICFSSDRHMWATRPMAWLFNKYWSPDQRVIVIGYKDPVFDLPKNFFFYSVSPQEYPADRWVDAALDFFEYYESERFIFFHEDYWLARKVDLHAVSILEKYMVAHADVMRIDLTADRLYAGGMRDVDYLECLDIIEAPQSPYQMSHQACIMDTKKYVQLLKALTPEQHSAWAVEINGTYYLNSQPWRVLGTRQYIARYANALLKGKLDWNELPKIKKEDYNAISGWIPESYKNAG